MAKRTDEPKCTHGGYGMNRVTNVADGDDYTKHKGHASIWVCLDKGCVLDAVAWVWRITGEDAYVYGPDADLSTASKP